MSDRTSDFLRGLFGDGKVVRHAISDGRVDTFTLCGGEGWCAEDKDVTCPACRVLLDAPLQAEVTDG